MLVGDLVFVEEFGHFLGDNVPIVGDGDEGDFLPCLWLRLRGRSGLLLEGLGLIHAG